MDDTELDDLLRAGDPLPGRTPLDPEVVARAVARTREVIRMEEQKAQRPKSRVIALAAAIALVAIAAVLGITQLRDGSDGGGTGGGVALGGGSTMTSCLAFSEEALGQAEIAFDGTVTEVAGDAVTLDVERWFRGGDGDTVTLHAPDLTGSLLEGGVGFEAGERYLVSAYRNGERIEPAVCGFSVTYSDDMAETFERAFG